MQVMLCGQVGGGLSFIGAAINRATGARKLGSFFRSLGGIMKSLEQVNLGHLRAGKKFFFTSGIAMCAATLCNYLSEFIPKTHGVLYPISIGLDDLAKCLLTISQKQKSLAMVSQMIIDHLTVITLGDKNIKLRTTI